MNWYEATACPADLRRTSGRGDDTSLFARFRGFWPTCTRPRALYSVACLGRHLGADAAEVSSRRRPAPALG